MFIVNEEDLARVEIWVCNKKISAISCLKKDPFQPFEEQDIWAM